MHSGENKTLSAPIRLETARQRERSNYEKYIDNYDGNILFICSNIMARLEVKRDDSGIFSMGTNHYFWIKTNGGIQPR